MLSWHSYARNGRNKLRLLARKNLRKPFLRQRTRASVNKTYTYYMQQLNKLIIENKALQNENEALKAENAKVKQHISQLDENAVRRVTIQKDAVIESLNTQLASKNEDITKLKTDYNTLWEKYKILVFHWNDLRKQPEIIEAVKRVEERKEQEAEAKREEQARQDRYQGVLDRFISEDHEQLQAFSQSSRIDFYEKETKAIYYGIMATATKSNIVLRSPQGVINHKVYPDNDKERRFIALITTNRLKLQKCDAQNKDFQLFVLSSE